jgi:cytoskeletal protein CcmA (bactofilin family)
VTTPDIRQPGGETVFKRRKPDDPQSAVPGTMLPAGLPSSDQPDFPDHPGGMSGAISGASAGPVDTSLGVPPFRPAPPQEAQIMARPPFTTAPAPQSTPQPGVRPAVPPPPLRAPARDSSERRTLVVGRGISVQGTVQDAERLVVEGNVEASMLGAHELAISPGGVFKGEIEVEDAEIAGTIDGTVTARGSLIVRSTGKVVGTARCRRLQVEDGGQITGHIEMLTDQSRAEAPRAATEPAV